jgi:proteic killer suppression protein
VIQSFRCKDTERLFGGGPCPKQFRVFCAQAERKLAMLDAARNLTDLKSPPGNKLEALRGDRTGQHSIRINDQWRVCFVWAQEGPTEVEIVDYH